MSVTTWPLTNPPTAVMSLLRQSSQTREEVSSQDLCVQMLQLQDLDQATLDAWFALEERALEGNPFLSPSFVLPSMRYLTPQADLRLLFVSRRDRPRELIAMAAFTAHGPSLRIPVPHLRAYKGRHSFLTGALLDRRMPESGARALFQHLWSLRWRWQAIEWIQCSHHTPQAAILEQAAAERGLHWHHYATTSRAALYPGQLHPQPWHEHFKPRDRRNLQRRMRRLQDLGQLHYRSRTPETSLDHDIERFLALEDMGWKAQQHTSIASQPSDEPFFREMFHNFAQRGMAWVTALDLDHDTFAISANLRSAQEGFTFKLGWDPAYRAQAPGILLAAQMLQHAQHDCPRLDMIDSCAEPDAFVERLWPGRRSLKSGVYTMGITSDTLLRGVRGALSTRGRLRHLWQRWRRDT